MSDSSATGAQSTRITSDVESEPAPATSTSAPVVSPPPSTETTDEPEPPTTTSTPEPPTTESTTTTEPPDDPTTTSPANLPPTSTPRPPETTITLPGPTGFTTTVITITSTADVPTPPSITTGNLPGTTSPPPDPTSGGGIGGGGNSSDTEGGLKGPAVIAVAVIVPVLIIGLIICLVLFLVRKKKNKRMSQTLVNNPLPPPSGGLGAAVGGDGSPDDFGEDGSHVAGYRGWGSTAGGRTMKSGSVSNSTGYPMSAMGKSVSDSGYGTNQTYGVAEPYPAPTNIQTSPVYPPGISPTFPPDNLTMSSNGRSAAPLIDRTAPSPAFTEASMIGPMPTFDSRGNDQGLNRGVSNASSNYSTVSHSEHSDYDRRNSQQPVYGANDDNPYFGRYYEDSQQSQPVIRDVLARRNTQIETPTSSHFPSSGIAQNF